MNNHHSIVNKDAQISYQLYGNGDEWLVIANAPGMSNKFFAPIIKLLEDRFRILIWDYRGISPSGDIPDKERLSIADHADDLSLLFSENKISKANLMGWCIGPKVLVEFFKNNPEKCASFTFLNFSFNRFSDWDEVTDFDRSIIKVADILKKKPAASKNLIKVIKELQSNDYENLLDIIDDMEDQEYVLNLVNSLDSQSNFADLSLNKFQTEYDLINYFIIYNNFIQHYCLDVLADIHIPTLIFSGSNDTWTPTRTLKKLHEMISGSRFIEIENTTHYLLFERPKDVTDIFHDFIKEIA
jgi:pimeloyl-ACP methyl ester carboxylesterase